MPRHPSKPQDRQSVAESTASPLTLVYLNAPDVAALRADRRRDPRCRRARTARAGRRPNGDRAAHAPATPRPRPSTGHFNVLRGYIAPLGLAGVKVVGDYVDNYTLGLPSEMGAADLFDPRTGGRWRSSTPPASPTCARAPSRRSARAIWRAGQPRARAHRRARHRVLERAAARSAVRLRRDSRSLAAAGIRDAFAARLAADLGKPVARPTTGKAACAAPTSSSRPRGCRSRADAAHRVDQAGRVRRSVRDDERRRAVADRHHGQDRRRRLGTVQDGPVRRAARARRRRQADRARRCTRSSARSSPGASPAASATTRRSCSGIAGCRCPTSRSVPRCWTRRRGCASARRCAIDERLTRDARALVANARMYAVNPDVGGSVGAPVRVGRRRGRGRLSTWSRMRRRNHSNTVARADLGCAFMCGYPCATWQKADRDAPGDCSRRRSPRRRAMPDVPVYCTDIVVRSGFDVHNDRCAARQRASRYTVENSQSGCQAPRRVFAECCASMRAARSVRRDRRTLADTAWRGRRVARRAHRCRSSRFVVARSAAASEPATASRLRMIASTPSRPFRRSSAAVVHARRLRLAAASAHRRRAGSAASAIPAARVRAAGRGLRDRARYPGTNVIGCTDTPPAPALGGNRSSMK